MDEFDNPVLAADSSSIATEVVDSGNVARQSISAISGTGNTRTLTLGAINVNPGSYRLKFSGVGSGSILSRAFTVNSNLPSVIHPLQGPTDVATGATPSPTISFEIRDNFGNKITTGENVTVTLSLLSADGLTSLGTTGLANNVVSSTNGTVEFGSLTITRAPGTYKLRATATYGGSTAFGGNVDSAATFKVTNSAPASLQITNSIGSDKAADFELDSSQYLVSAATDFVIPSTGDYTVEAWVKPESFADFRQIFSQGDGNGRITPI